MQVLAEQDNGSVTGIDLNKSKTTTALAETLASDARSSLNPTKSQAVMASLLARLTSVRVGMMDHWVTIQAK